MKFVSKKIECNDPKIRLTSIGSNGVLLEDYLGEEIFHIIYDGFSKYENIELSFKGVKHVTTAFLSASIGNIYLKYPKKAAEKLSFSDISNPLIKHKIEAVIDRALNPKEYNKLVDNALADL